MHLVNTPHYPNRIFFVSCLLIISANVFGQKKIPVNWNVFRKEVGDHWVASFHHSPEFYLNSPLIFDTGLKTDIKKLSTLTFGTTILKSSPKRTFTYGFKLDYNYSLNDIKSFNSLYRYDIQSISSSFSLGCQKPNIVKNNHFFFNLGISQRVLFSNKLDLYENNKVTNFSKDIGLNKLPTFGYLEFGLQQDEFLKMNERTRLKNLSVSIDFPFFNRSNLFSSNKKNYNEKVIGFYNTKNPEFAFRLNYQQYIDTKKYIFQGDVDYKRHLFLPPIVSIEDPDNPVFGRIFVDFAFSSLKDSVNVSSDNTNLKLIPNSILNQIGIGYNLHVGNYKETQDMRTKNKNIYYDFFTGLSIFKSTITSSYKSIYKYESIGLKAIAGGRIGHKNGFYILGGTEFQILERAKKYSQNLTVQEDNLRLPFPFNKGFSFFGGVAYKNLITLKLHYNKTEIIRENPAKILDNFSYSIAIGF